jgi:hypothetical protein
MIHARYVKEEVLEKKGGRVKKDGKVKKKKKTIVARWVGRIGDEDPLMVLLLESPTDLA